MACINKTSQFLFRSHQKAYKVFLAVYCIVVLFMRVMGISKRQKDFNDDMGAYLDSRRGSVVSPKKFLNTDFSFLRFSSDDRVPEVPVTESTVYEREKKPSLFSIFFARFRTSKEKQDALDEIDELPSDIAEEVEEVEDEIEHVQEEVQELEDQREGLLSRLFSLFRRAKVSEEYEEDSVGEPVVDEQELLKRETRETLRVIHKWIGRLSPDQINAFKRSPDFQRYKDLLDKYGLIK
ncbi:hypothetical protein K9M74_04510 [Candidatus Woesearchaeota archaeon]|nr:hypothetical protein [Candidatus Woesearchaeota archaeon]